MGRSRPLNKLFAEADDTRLAQVIATATQLITTQQLIVGLLPAELRSQVGLAELDTESLTLICASSAVSSRLRFLETDLLGRLGHLADLPTPNRLKIIVRQGWSKDHLAGSADNKDLERKISAESANLLRQASAAIRNPRLQQALQRLAGPDCGKSNQAEE